VEAETGVMQGASQGVSNNQALRKRSVVVRTVCPDRKKRLAPAHQDDVFATYLTDGDGTVGKIANEEPNSKVAFLWFFGFSHIFAANLRSYCTRRQDSG
jgi:hypothetical protein